MSLSVLLTLLFIGYVRTEVSNIDYKKGYDFVLTISRYLSKVVSVERDPLL